MPTTPANAAEEDGHQHRRLQLVAAEDGHVPRPGFEALRDGQPRNVGSDSTGGADDPDGDRVSVEWDFDNDGDLDSREMNHSLPGMIRVHIPGQ